MTILDFIHHLAATRPPQNCANPYQYNRPFSSERRHNFQTYLTLMRTEQPVYLFIGEAPGYRRCRLTGIPFVSKYVLRHELAHFPGLPDAFCPVAEWPYYQKEASATIVWRAIRHWHPLPLLWNIFPFHPHLADRPQTNRTPTSAEVRLGRPFLEQLLTLFPQTNLIAVGQKAADALEDWRLHHLAVRHPSHGGAGQFQAAVNQLK